ncbi:MAG: prepilin-type cleavage/methylation domain-containing protein [Verrucomicrobia bacterium]|nr:MAG: prepilin-type cleavage/methylation domain-containing protein [Verrucomicrobiota bacterium]
MKSASVWGCRRQAFTLVEIMIIVALIGLLAALATPSFIKVRKQSQGKRVVSDARIIDAAIDSWSLETGKADGETIDLAAAAQYTKLGTINPVDLLGNDYQIGVVGPTQLVISATTKGALAGVGIDWGAY